MTPSIRQWKLRYINPTRRLETIHPHHQRTDSEVLVTRNYRATDISRSCKRRTPELKRLPAMAVIWSSSRRRPDCLCAFPATAWWRAALILASGNYRRWRQHHLPPLSRGGVAGGVGGMGPPHCLHTDGNHISSGMGVLFGFPNNESAG